ncbi:MAG: hypothetical protein LUO89_00880 [Methanothrix sp.]|nr:hypothetical protein [Methanothrix sp.]
MIGLKKRNSVAVSLDEAREFRGGMGVIVDAAQSGTREGGCKVFLATPLPELSLRQGEARNPIALNQISSVSGLQ